MEDVDANHPDLLPDYRVPVSETYIRAARYLLNKEGLSYLFEVVGFPQSANSLPPWVPDWSKTKLRSSLDLDHVKREFTAGGILPPAYRLSGDELPDKLIVQGLMPDTVEKIETMFDYGTLPWNEAHINFFMNTSEFMKQSAMTASGLGLAYPHIITLTLAQSSTTLPFSEFEAISQILKPFYHNDRLLRTTAEEKSRIGTSIAKVTVDSAFLGFCLTKNSAASAVFRTTPELVTKSASSKGYRNRLSFEPMNRDWTNMF